jgi:hypothetical protein
MNNKDSFYAISDRYNFENLPFETREINADRSITCFRGDCYINTFTYRLNRNFNDPSLPNNETIVDWETWGNYVEGDFGAIILSDVNAVKLGSWITFRVFSSFNYALRG